MKYTKSALGLLNAQYRSVLKKCLLINLGLFALSAPAMADSQVVVGPGQTWAPETATTITGVSSDEGALTVKSGTIAANVAVTLSDNTSTSHGAALYYKDQNETSVSSAFNNNVTFSGNTSTASASSGGAVFVSGGNVSFLGDNNIFTGNKIEGTDVAGKLYKRGGGAIDNQSYENESSHSPIDSVMVIGKNTSTNTFSNNISSMNGGAIMNRAVDEDGNATLTINGNSTFSGNQATGKGGAIYNIQATGHTSTLNITGSALFENNTDSTGANDIYNTGTLNLVATTINDSIVLNGGIDGDSENKGTTNISGEGYVKVANALKNQNVNNTGLLVLDNAALDGTEISGDGSIQIAGDSEIEDTTLTDQAMEVETGEELTLNDVILNKTAVGKGTLTNKAGGILTINGTSTSKSQVNVDIDNYGRLISDPTSYSGTVNNYAGAYASFDNDTFTNTATLANNGTVDLKNTVTFASGAAITGAGDINLTTGSTTVFNNTANANTINLLSSADWSGTINGGTVNAINGAIDSAITGSVSNTTNLYVDATLGNTGTIDQIAGGTIKKISLTGDSSYGANETLTLTAASGSTFDANVEIEGMNYYTEKTVSGNTLTLSNKLINTSTIRGTGDGSTTFVGDVKIGDKADNTQIGTANVNLTIDESDKTAELLSGTSSNGAHVALDSKTSKSVDISAIDSTASKNANIDVNGTNGKIKLEANDTGATKTAKVEVDGTNAQVKATAANGLVISNGTPAQDATLTTTANGLNVNKGLTVGTAGTYGIAADGAATVNSLKIGASGTPMTAVDGTAGTGNTTLATVATVTDKINNAAGAGLKSSGGVLSLDLTAKGGLQLDGSGDAATLSVLTDNSTIVKDATTGALKVNMGAAYTGSTLADVNAYVTANATKIANIGTTAALVEDLLEAKEAWIGNELGYDTTTTDAHTILGAAGFTDQTGDGKLGVVDAELQLKTTIGDVDYSDEPAVTGSVLKTGTGATKTVRGALDAVDTAIKDITTDPTTGAINVATANVGTSITIGSDATPANNVILTQNTDKTLNISQGLKVNGNEEITGNLSVAGTSTFTGAVTANGNVTLGDAATDTVTVKGTATFDEQIAATKGIAAGTNGTALTDNSLVLQGSGSGVKATLTGTANGLNVAEGLTVGTAGSEKFKVTAGGDTTVNSLKIGASGTTISSITTASGVAALLANPTSASDNKLMTEAAVVTGIKALVDQKEAWIGNELGYNTTTTDAHTILGAAGFTDQTGEGKLGVVDAALQLNTKIGDVDYSDEPAVTGSVLKTGTGATTTVRGALDALDTAVKDITTDTTTGAINVATANVGTQLKVGTGTTLTTNTVSTTTVNATTVNAGTNGTALTNGQLVLNGDGTNAATLTSTANGLDVAEGLTVATNKFTVDASGNTAVAGTLDVTGATTLGSTLAVTGNTTVGGTLGVTGLTTLSATNGMQFGTGQVVTSVDTAGIAKGVAGTAAALASTQSVVNTIKAQAEDANYTTTGANITAATTIGGAINTLDTEIGADTDYASTNNGVAGANSVKANINAINAKVGNVASVVVNGYTASSGTLTGAVSALNTNMTNVLGGVYKADGTYDASTLTSGIYGQASGTAGNLTASLNNMATNVSAATGTTYAANGSFTNTYTSSSTTVSYGVPTATTNLATAIGQVATNVGTAAQFTAGKGNVAATNTVNANLNTLDAAIGDRSNIGSANAAINTAIQTDVATAVKKIGDEIGTQTYVNNAGVNYGAIAANTDLTTAVSQVASNVGTAAQFTAGKGNVAAANTVNANLNTLDDHMGDLAKLTHNAFGVATPANVADITTAMNSLATNVATGMGGTFAANGSWSDTVVNTTSNGYTYTATANIMDSLDQVAGNVGTAAQLTNGYNGVATTQSVNTNLNAINGTIGDITKLSADTGGSVGNALSNGTGVKPTTVVTALNNIDATLGKIHGLKASSDLGDKSNLASGTTVENHLVSLDNAIGDRSFATTRYVAPNSDLATAVTALDSNLSRVEHKVDDLRHDFEGGMASMAAMSALVPNPRSSGDTSLSIGTGAYGSHTAVAFGGFHYLTDNILLNAGAAWGNTDDLAYRLGVTWSW